MLFQLPQLSTTPEDLQWSQHGLAAQEAHCSFVFQTQAGARDDSCDQNSIYIYLKSFFVLFDCRQFSTASQCIQFLGLSEPQIGKGQRRIPHAHHVQRHKKKHAHQLTRVCGKEPLLAINHHTAKALPEQHFESSSEERKPLCVIASFSGKFGKTKTKSLTFNATQWQSATPANDCHDACGLPIVGQTVGPSESFARLYHRWLFCCYEQCISKYKYIYIYMNIRINLNLNIYIYVCVCKYTSMY